MRTNGFREATAHAAADRCDAERAHRDPATRVLAVVHDADCPPARLEAWTAAHGLTLEVVELYKGDRLPLPSDWRCVVSLGSRASVTDGADWMRAEVDFLREVDRRDTPILGCCFGAQILAVALGGTVGQATKPEIGWHVIDTDQPHLIAPGPWLEWHEDAIGLPPGATEIARTGRAVQAFSVRKHVGVQFHPEASSEIVRSWSCSNRAELVRHGIDHRALEAQTIRHEASAGHRAEILFDAFVAGRFGG